jgi:hypothetical protein
MLYDARFESEGDQIVRWIFDEMSIEAVGLYL